ncbi:MAG: ABC transporter ATP-binding protein [Clostridia bacterium]|nr:ABC transporter ATP-binding protein [Clostridia bacterium]
MERENSKDNIIEISHLYKSFKDVKAVCDLSFCVKKGELFAFLGVNGAGKSTTISIICNRLRKDGGSVIINGEDIDRRDFSTKKDLGVVFQNSVLDKALSVKDNLLSRAALYGIKGKEFDERLARLDSLLDISPLLKRAVGKLSGGQRRRVDIARALLHSPKILILDEPTTGLDPQTRKTLWKVISELRESDGLTVFLTTHYMEEAAEADYVVIIDSGKIVAEGTPLELKNKYTGDFILIYGSDGEKIKSLELPYEKIADGYRIGVPDTKKATELIVRYPDIFDDYEVVKGKMDDVFLSVTGKKLTGGNADE